MTTARRIGWTLALAVAAECAAPAAQRLGIPFYAQQKNGCGAASVAMVMDYWKSSMGARSASEPSPLDVYQALYRPELRGVELLDMKRYLEAAGLRAFTLHGEWADIEQHLAKGRPVIAGLKAGRNRPIHFVVVAGTEPGFVWLNDPTRKKPVRLPRARFEQRWALADRWMLLAAASGRE
jgi:ABC-type bacteriocin/lantibiotic exporter with double-glycine peptidase domain